MPEYRYFKCNKIGGFRLSDLNKNVIQGEYFQVDSHVAETSRSVIASIKGRWMVEVSASEAKKYFSAIEKIKGGVVSSNVTTKKAKNESENVAIPNVGEVNKNLESRQSEKNKLTSEVATPNKKVAKEKKKEEIEIKVSGPEIKKVQEKKKEEIEKKAKEDVSVAIPNVGKVEKKTEERQKEETGETKVIGPDDKRKEELKKAKKEGKKEESVVKSLSIEDDSQFDNEMLSTPNFDEKSNPKEEIKNELEKRIEKKKKIRRKKSIST